MSRVIGWIDSLRADAVIGLRRLRAHKITSGAAVLSLALALGSCASAFRLIDALLLRPLPISHPESFYRLARGAYDGWEHSRFLLMRDAVAKQATLIAISFAEQVDLTYGSDDAMEKGHVQYVSGSMFDAFGLRPAAGRLAADNAVLSHDYWSRRFGRDPNIVGHGVRIGDRIYEIAGVANAGFTGTEPGTVIDLFLPETSHWGVGHEWSVFRVFAQLKPGVAAEPVHAQLTAVLQAIHERKSLTMQRADAGASGLQANYRLSLAALGVLVALVLLIACANVANLMTAQAAARTREMALRVSIGAGRLRLVQLVLIESAWIAIGAAAGGALLAWWSAPFVVRMISTPDHPAQLFFPPDWRALGFGVLLTLGVTFLFGLGPALRASAVKPASALKGGGDPRSRRRWMRGLIAMQAGFCFVVLFVAGLFVLTFEKLSNQPTGISSERILALYTVSRQSQPQAFWTQAAEHLRGLHGVEKVAIADWPILDGWGFRSSSISTDGAPPREGGWFLNISPGMLDVMKMPLLDGRDFTETDTTVAIVNTAFARQYFNGENPIGKWFAGSPTNTGPRRYQVVGLVRDARYRYLREEFVPVAYIPYRRLGVRGDLQGSDRGTFLVRTADANPMTMASVLRAEIPKARPGFRVSNIRTQKELIESQTVRERLLAMLGLFFAMVALLLAGVGLYGVLNYSVVERRREIGIRLAIGAQAGRIARLVTMDIFAMVVVGAAAGLGVGMASVRYIETLFFQVKATDLGMLAVPGMVIMAAALTAAVPAVIHAVRIDPVETLRAE